MGFDFSKLNIEGINSFFSGGNLLDIWLKLWSNKIFRTSLITLGIVLFIVCVYVLVMVIYNETSNRE